MVVRGWRYLAVVLGSWMVLTLSMGGSEQTSSEEHALATMGKVRDEVLGLLLLGAGYEAKEVIATAERNPILDDFTVEMRDLRTLTQAASTVDTIILEQFRPDFGKVIRLNLLRETVYYRPSGVNVRFLIGERLAQSTDKRGTRANYLPAQLHIDERLARLEQSQHAFAPHLMALMTWRWGKRREAREYLRQNAEKPLAEPLLKLMEDPVDEAP